MLFGGLISKLIKMIRFDSFVCYFIEYLEFILKNIL